MIVAERKLIEEIVKMLTGHKVIMIAGCGECTTVCFAGGEKEVGILANQLRLLWKKQGEKIEISEQTTKRQKKILFIDDDLDYVESMKVFLEKKYEVMTAFSVDEGREKIGRQRPDLIILDAMMEPTSGFALAKELKAHQIYKDIPIVMLTGVVPKIPQTKYSPDDILRYEGEDFVEKSAGIERLLFTVDRYLK